MAWYTQLRAQLQYASYSKHTVVSLPFTHDVAYIWQRKLWYRCTLQILLHRRCSCNCKIALVVHSRVNFELTWLCTTCTPLKLQKQGSKMFSTKTSWDVGMVHCLWIYGYSCMENTAEKIQEQGVHSMIVTTHGQHLLASRHILRIQFHHPYIWQHFDAAKLSELVCFHGLKIYCMCLCHKFFNYLQLMHRFLNSNVACVQSSPGAMYIFRTWDCQWDIFISLLQAYLHS